jgi:hypothetical protein
MPGRFHVLVSRSAVEDEAPLPTGPRVETADPSGSLRGSSWPG